MSEENFPITIYRGSSRLITLSLVDERDETEDLSSVAGKRVGISASAGESPIKWWEDSDVSIDVDAGTLTVELTAVDSGLFTSVGAYVLDAAVEIGSKWYHTDPIYVLVTDPVTPLPE